jgi:F0F1-type ATP synthase assembly protein I
MSSSWKAAYRYGNIGLELFLSIVVGFVVGRWVDRRWLSGHGWGTAVGTALGVYTGFRSLWKLAKQAQREAEAEEVREQDKADRDARLAAYRREADAIEDEAEDDDEDLE